MESNQSDWRENAKRIYRDALTQLRTLSETSDDHMVEFLKEELRESLLDLKQAVIAERMDDALASVGEVRICLIELNQRLRGDS